MEDRQRNQRYKEIKEKAQNRSERHHWTPGPANYKCRQNTKERERERERERESESHLYKPSQSTTQSTAPRAPRYRSFSNAL